MKFSEQDRALYERFSWYVASKGALVCTNPQTGALLYFHREVMSPPSGMEVDHINGDQLDNRRENLRICTHAENLRNRAMFKNNRSGYPNVYFESARARRKASFTAQVRIAGRKVRRSGFDTAEAAFEVAKQLIADMHGEFASVRRLQQ